MIHYGIPLWCPSGAVTTLGSTWYLASLQRHSTGGTNWIPGIPCDLHPPAGLWRAPVLRFESRCSAPVAGGTKARCATCIGIRMRWASLHILGGENCIYLSLVKYESIFNCLRFPNHMQSNKKKCMAVWDHMGQYPIFFSSKSLPKGAVFCWISQCLSQWCLAWGPVLSCHQGERNTPAQRKRWTGQLGDPQLWYARIQAM